MSKAPVKITEIKAEERRQEREQNRRGFFNRLLSVFKFLLVLAVFVIALNHRAEIQRVCHAGFARAMKHFTLSPQLRQKSDAYQDQLDGVTTN